MALTVPRNHRVTGSSGRRIYRGMSLLPAALAAAFVVMVLAASAGLAQDTAGEAGAGKSAPGLRTKSVIVPKTVIVEPSVGQTKANAQSGDPADNTAVEVIAAAPRSFRVGIVPRGETAAFLRTLEPFRAAIAKTLGRPAEILPFSNFTALIDAQALHRIDLGFYSASAYALADKACSCLDPLVAPAAADGSMAFQGIIIARRQSGITSLDDLKGREIAAGAPDSVGSRRVQMAELSAGGIDVGSYFSDVKTARSALDAVLMVRDDRVAAAFAWIPLAGDAGAGNSRGPLAHLVERGELSMDEIAIIWRSRPIAHAPIAVARSLPGDVRQALSGLFINLADDDPQTYDLLDRGYGGGYRAVKRQDYAGAMILADQDVAVREAEPTRLIPRLRPQQPGFSRQGVN
jgi:phosphonate transport system substrate-binding protein